MKNSKISRLFGRGAREQGSAEPSADVLITSAQRHFADEFPNPRRVACPRPEELSEVIRSEQLPGTILRRHLLDCSECCRDFRESLQAHREAHQSLAPAHRTQLVPSFAWRKLTIASATLLLLISAIGFIAWLQGGKESQTHQALTPTPVPLESAGPSSSPKTPQSLPKGSIERGVEQVKKSPSSMPPPVLLAANHVEINFETATRSRGAAPQGERETLLSTGHNEIVIRLPSRSPVGTYQITLADPFGNPIASSSARSRDGIALLTNLKLTSVKPGRYLFCVTREAEVPDCVPALVGPPK